MKAYVTWILSFPPRSLAFPVSAGGGGGGGATVIDVSIHSQIKAEFVKGIPRKNPTVREESSHRPSGTKRVSLGWKPLGELLRQLSVQRDTLHTSSQPGTAGRTELLLETTVARASRRARRSQLPGLLTAAQLKAPLLSERLVDLLSHVP